MTDYLPHNRAPAVDSTGSLTREFREAFRRVFRAFDDRLTAVESAETTTTETDTETSSEPTVNDVVGQGLIVRGAQWLARTLTGTANEITVTNGNGVSGHPTVSLAGLADSGTGTFKLLTRDAKGRLSGTADGDAADVPYDNTASGLSATDVQGAIDEVAATPPGASAMVLLGSAEVSGAAATTLSVSGLNLGAYSHFRVVFSVKNATGTDETIGLYYNGDTTDANYYRQSIVASGGVTTVGRSNDGLLASLYASSGAFGVLDIANVDGKPVANGTIQAGLPANIEHRTLSRAWVTAANLTRIDLTCSAAALAVGSRIAVYGIN